MLQTFFEEFLFVIQRGKNILSDHTSQIAKMPPPDTSRVSPFPLVPFPSESNHKIPFNSCPRTSAALSAHFFFTYSPCSSHPSPRPPAGVSSPSSSRSLHPSIVVASGTSHWLKAQTPLYKSQSHVPLSSPFFTYAVMLEISRSVSDARSVIVSPCSLARCSMQMKATS
jgi:hypothetical protein